MKTDQFSYGLERIFHVRLFILSVPSWSYLRNRHWRKWFILGRILELGKHSIIFTLWLRRIDEVKRGRSTRISRTNFITNGILTNSWIAIHFLEGPLAVVGTTRSAILVATNFATAINLDASNKKRDINLATRVNLFMHIYGIYSNLFRKSNHEWDRKTETAMAWSHLTWPFDYDCARNNF